MYFKQNIKLNEEKRETFRANYSAVLLFFKFKIAYSYQCNSKIPPQKVSLVFKGVTWLGKLHFNL